MRPYLNCSELEFSSRHCLLSPLFRLVLPSSRPDSVSVLSRACLLIYAFANRMEEGGIREMGFTPRAGAVVDPCCDDGRYERELIPHTVGRLSMEGPHRTADRAPPNSGTELHRTARPSSTEQWDRAPPSSGTELHRTARPSSTEQRDRAPPNSGIELHWTAGPSSTEQRDRAPPNSGTEIHRTAGSSSTEQRDRAPPNSETGLHRTAGSSSTERHHRCYEWVTLILFKRLRWNFIF